MRDLTLEFVQWRASMSNENKLLLLIKKVGFLIGTGIWMSLGYAIMVGFLVGILFLVFFGLPIYIENHVEYPILFYPIDFLIFVLTVYIGTRKWFRFRVRELWNQIWMNL